MSTNIKDDNTSYPNDDYSRFAAPDFKENSPVENHFNLGEQACALLMKNPDLNASQIIVSVHGDSLTLRGVVDNHIEKIEAEACLRAIPEVSTILNELQVRR